MAQALIVALVYWALILIYRFGANGMADRPIVVGPIVGLVLGDVVTGTLIGAQLEVIYLGIVNVGGAQATDTLYATTMAAALSIISGIPQEAAITLAIPLGFIGLFMLQVTRIFFCIYVSGPGSDCRERKWKNVFRGVYFTYCCGIRIRSRYHLCCASGRSRCHTGLYQRAAALYYERNESGRRYAACTGPGRASEHDLG